MGKIFTMFTVLSLACILVFALPVDGICTEARFRILEYNFVSSFCKVRLLPQSTDANVNGPDDDCTNKTDLDSFAAEKIQRVKLEERVSTLEEIVKHLEESSRSEREAMNQKITQLTDMQQTLIQLVQRVQNNSVGIEDVAEEINTSLDSFKLDLNQEMSAAREDLVSKIIDVEDLTNSNTKILSQKLESYALNTISTDDLPHLLNRTKISFSARVRPSVGNLEPDSTLIFSEIIVNDGNAYSGTTGIFTAPVNGTYVFNVHILGANRALEMKLKKNNEGVMWLYVNGPGHGADSNMVVLQLNVGDTVNVVKHGSNGTPPFYVHHVWSTFSGFKI